MRPDRRRIISRLNRSSRVNNCWIQDDAHFTPEQFEHYRNALATAHAQPPRTLQILSFCIAAYMTSIRNALNDCRSQYAFSL